MSVIVMLNRTLEPLRRRNKQQDRLKAKATAVIYAMRHGQTLHRHHAWYGAVWSLSNGLRVKDEIAQIVVQDPTIVGDGDALPLGDVPAQTYHWHRRRIP
jgi:hypothetical protein